jgi:hypothetical protein
MIGSPVNEWRNARDKSRTPKSFRRRRCPKQGFFRQGEQLRPHRLARQRPYWPWYRLLCGALHQSIVWHLSLDREPRLAMERYIHEQNLLNYRRALSETTDPAKRQTLLNLIASELANVPPPSKTT